MVSVYKFNCFLDGFSLLIGSSSLHAAMFLYLTVQAFLLSMSQKEFYHYFRFKISPSDGTDLLARFLF
jgi:hypothetical protein